MRRIGIVAALFLGLSAPAAWACNDPSLGGVSADAGVGGQVVFSAVHLDPGASYFVTLAGQIVASGTATGETINGSFEMPDLGASGVYYLELRVEHEEGTWVSTQPIRFSGQAPTPPRAQSAPAQPAPAQPAPQAGTPPAPPTHAAVHATARVTASAPRHRAEPRSPRAVPVRHAVQSRVSLPAAKPTRAPSVRVPVPAITRKAPRVAPRHRPRHAAAPAREQRRVVRPPVFQDEPRSVGVVVAPRTFVAQRSHSYFPPLPYLLLAVGLLAATAAASILAAGARRRAAACEHELHIESELQELIAEARAEEPTSLRSE